MPRFTFTLQGVLQHRQHLENLQQRELAGHLRQVQTLDAEVRELREQLQEMSESGGQPRRTGALDIAFLLTHSKSMISLQARIKDATARRDLAAAELEVARGALTQAVTRRKAIEKLREAQHASWLERENRRECAEQDETASQIQVSH